MYSWVRLSHLIKWTHAKLATAPNDFPVRQISTDTRTLQSGDVYVALKGENFDGHNFIQDALQKKASAIVSEKDINHGSIPCLRVRNTLEAFVSLGRGLRNEFKGEVAAITGSAGKSSTKDMVSTLLGEGTLKSPASFNNLVGVAKTLCLIDDKTKRLVLEMGMNAKGEIRELCENFSPDAGLITNIGDAHIGKLGGPEAVYEAKKELFDYLAGREKSRVALNLDDEQVVRAYQAAFRNAKPTVLSYSLEDSKANVILLNRKIDPNTGYLNLELKMDQKNLPCSLPIFGLHQAQNILAATTLARLMGETFESIKDRISLVRPASHRGEIHKLDKDVFLIDETYNSNPKALLSSLQSLFEGIPERRKWLILGGMRELGDFSEKLHRDVGRMIQGWMKKSKSPVRILGVGGDSKFLLEEIQSPEKAYVEDVEAAKRAVLAKWQPGELLFLKGSRGIGLDRLISAILT